VFFVSVTVNAVLGIYAVVAPDFGDMQRRMLLTSLCITGAVLMALCCEPAWERRLLWQIPAAGALLGVAAFAGLIVGIWAEPESETLRNLLFSTFAVAIACTVASVVVLEWARKGVTVAHQRVLSSSLAFAAVAAVVACALIWTRPSEDTIGKFSGSGWAIGVALALGALLTLARLAAPHRWVLTLALGLLAFGTAAVVVRLWVEGGGSILTRVMGVALIAFAAVAVTVPVLHWLDRSTLAVAESTSAATRFCPYCGGKLVGEVGTGLECGRCGRGFTVTPSVEVT
jgi:ribosomal protein S27AE